MSTEPPRKQKTGKGILFGLLLLSGSCSLVYQVVWLREFRLIFGGTTAASATVFAVFMGGLGFGSLYFGNRSEASSSPLRLYGFIELGASALALSSIPVIAMSHQAYIASGGVFSLGLSGAYTIRLGLVALAIGPCAFLMGGNLPVAIKFLQRERDTTRRGTAALYGVNAIGALCGALAATFFLLEHLGSIATLICATILNGLVATVAIRLSKSLPAPRSQNLEKKRDSDAPYPPTTLDPRSLNVVLAFSFLAGFVFFVMELVWIRMLTPLMGGSVYVPGVMLAVVLAGIGIGGLAYTCRREAALPTTNELAVVMTLFACSLALPLGLGDRIPLWAFHLNKLRDGGFLGQIGAWLAITSILVLLPSLLAGYQFPLLVGLMGKGNRTVGRHVGLTYALNTLGAVSGSLAGGLVLLPNVGAINLWRGLVGLTLVMAAVALSFWSSQRSKARSLPLFRWITLSAGAVAIVLAASPGPSAVWRHTPIGYGARISTIPQDPVALTNWLHSNRFAFVDEYEGRESHIGIVNGKHGLNLHVNGKSDGSARGNAPTFIMTGLIGALFHPGPESACVIGLGTGSTAGWLADVPGMKRVDVIEIEPKVVEFARLCEPVNREILKNPAARIIIGDGRETLLTRSDTYDIIASQPSNPYRAGIANLYTRDFYQIVQRRMKSGGVFLQWVQAYEINREALMLVYRTLRSVFPVVQTWQAGPQDIVFRCLQTPQATSLQRIDQRLQEPFFQEALSKAWNVDSREGLLSHFLCTSRFADLVASEGGAINTDDRNLLEFYFARNLSRSEDFRPRDLRLSSQSMGTLYPPLPAEDLARLNTERLTLEGNYLSQQTAPRVRYSSSVPSRLSARIEAVQAWRRGALSLARERMSEQPSGLTETLAMAESWADGGDDRAAALIADLVRTRPIEAKVFLARLSARQERLQAAVELLDEGFRLYRHDPWPLVDPMRRALQLAVEIHQSSVSTDVSRQLFNALELPFCLNLLERSRLATRLELATKLENEDLLTAVEAFGEHFPWTSTFLKLRLDAYTASGHPNSAQARRDLDELLEQESQSIAKDLAP